MNNEILEIAWMKSMLEILLLESKVNDSEWVIDNINLGCRTVAVSIGIRRELRENLLSGFHKAIDKYGYEDGVERITEMIIQKLIDVGEGDEDSISTKSCKNTFLHSPFSQTGTILSIQASSGTRSLRISSKQSDFFSGVAILAIDGCHLRNECV